MKQSEMSGFQCDESINTNAAMITPSLDDLPQICSPKKVSDFTGIPVSTLAFWRFEGSHLPFIKLGRMVRYRRQDVLDFLSSNIFTSTAEAKAAK